MDIKKRITSCPKKSNKAGTLKNGYCIYKFNDDSKHYSYGVLTYMYIDIPVISDVLKIPVYSRTDRIYKFN